MSAEPKIESQHPAFDVLQKALLEIRDGDTECQCGCTDDDCCNRVGAFCAHCLAAAALALADKEHSDGKH